MIFPTFKFEQQKIGEGVRLLAGCDEVGIAPLAGPVVAAAVILDPASIGKQRSKAKWWYRVRDSKTVCEKERGELYPFILDNCLSVSSASVCHETIDEINIFNAAQLAMLRSVAGLDKRPEFLFVDGMHKIKNCQVAHRSIIDGDAKVLSIAAASIIAKVTRDRILKQLDETCPQYGFVKHKGYPTAFHKQALLKFGISPCHRQSFALVRKTARKFCSIRYFRKLYPLT
jgi:ribonuclease HII